MNADQHVALKSLLNAAQVAEAIIEALEPNVVRTEIVIDLRASVARVRAAFKEVA